MRSKIERFKALSRSLRMRSTRREGRERKKEGNKANGGNEAYQVYL
jgi:hypothetical protein